MRTSGFGREFARGQGGFTLAELLAAIVILGILVTVAIIIIFGILEQRRVDAATRQLVSDMRLAHTSATNQLTDWRVVIVLERGDEEYGPDYYLVRLDRPYSGDARPKSSDRNIPRYFPGRVKAKNVITNSGSRVDDREAGYWLSPSALAENEETRTLEFNSDGTMRFYNAVSGSVCVTQDGDPQNRVSSLAATSRLRVEADSSCDTSSGEAGG